MSLVSISGSGVADRLLTSFWDDGGYRLKRSKTYTERWQWRGKGPIKSLWKYPRVQGYGLMNAKANYEPGFATFVWEYETLESAGGGGQPRVEQDEELAKIYEGNVGKSPITMHPEIGKWLGYRNPQTGKRYGRVVGGEVIWELENPTGAATRRGLTSDGSITTMNPFYGVSDYYEAGALSVTEEVRSKRDLLGIVNGIGTIEAPDGPANEPDKSRNWLYAGASATQVGNKMRVRKSWMMSGPGGWEPAIYSPSYWA